MAAGAVSYRKKKDSSVLCRSRSCCSVVTQLLLNAQSLLVVAQLLHSMLSCYSVATQLLLNATYSHVDLILLAEMRKDRAAVFLTSTEIHVFFLAGDFRSHRPFSFHGRFQEC